MSYYIRVYLAVPLPRMEAISHYHPFNCKRNSLHRHLTACRRNQFEKFFPTLLRHLCHFRRLPLAMPIFTTICGVFGFNCLQRHNREVVLNKLTTAGQADALRASRWPSCNGKSCPNGIGILLDIFAENGRLLTFPSPTASREISHNWRTSH